MWGNVGVIELGLEVLNECLFLSFQQVMRHVVL